MSSRVRVLTVLFLVSIALACHQVTPPRVADARPSRPRVRLTSSTIPANVPSQTAGSVAGSFTADGSGAATYSVPIAVPPGTAAVEPSLSLTYNSHRENGYAGMGWQLSGLSAIGRCGATYDVDGYKAGVAFDSRDRFCLDGNRLVAISGAYGADATIYHTANETQTSVISNGTCGNGPCSFTVYNKDGTRISFGGTTDARILAQGRSDGAVRTWAIDRQTDLNGNYTSVTYSSDVANGEYFPLRIDYTGNDATGLAPQRRVELAYESRTDPVRRYMGGSLVQATKRLRSITTSVGGATVRSYTLGYDTSAFTLRSRLTSITECDAAGVCLSPTTFAWQTEPGDFDSGPQLPGPLYVIVNSRVQPMGILQDLDGDGIADYSVATEFTSTTRDLKVWRGQPDGTFVEAGFSLPGPVFRVSSSSVVMCGVLQDINGDAILDYSPATYNASNGTTDLSVYLGTRNGFTKASFTLPDAVYWTVNNQTLQTGTLIDLNGDGIPDYSRASRLTSTNQYLLDIWKGTGSGFATTGQKLPGPIFAVSSSTSVRVGVLQDMNGDGITDYSPASVNASNGATDLDVWVGQTPDFTFTKSFQLPGQLLWIINGQSLDSGLLVDLNGDGIPDYSRATELTSNGQKLLDVFLGTGSGFVDGGFDLPGPIFLHANGRADIDGVLTQMNGDGTSRYSRATRYASNGTTQLEVWLGSGEGFRAASFQMPEPLYEIVNQQVYAKGIYEDINGDGMTDFANTTCTMTQPGVFTNCSLGVRLAKGPFSDLLTNITNGIGGTTAVEYLPLSNPAIYSRGDTPSYPVRDAQSSTYALSRYVSADERGSSYAFSYDYTGARFNVLGRNWLGFSKVVMTEDAGGRQSETTYSMTAPYYGLATATALRAGDGKTLETTTLAYADFAPPERQTLGIHQPLQTSYLNTIYQDGAPSFHYSREYDYDAFGNTVFEAEPADPSTNVLPVYHCARYANDAAPNVNRIGYPLQTKSAKTADACRSFLAIANGGDVKWDPATDLRWETTSYDANFNVLSEGSWDDSHSLFITSTYTVDPYGNTITLTGPNGATTTNTYDATFHTFLEQITNPTLTHADGTTYALTSSYITDPKFGTVVQTVDANGNVMQQDLDGFGRPVAEWGPDPEGNLVMLVSMLWHHENGRSYLESRSRPAWNASADLATWYWSREIYDGLQRPYRTETNALRNEQPATIVTEQFFDAQGRAYRQAAPHFDGDPVPITTTEYDALNRPILVTDPSGVKERYVYENGGLKVSRTQAYDTGVATTAIYYLDSESRTIRSVATNGQERTFTYDPLGQLIGTNSAPQVRSTTLAYDSMGRLRTLVRTDTGTTTWVYDQTNHIRTLIDASGNTVSYDAYDALDRVLQRRTVYAGGASQWNVTYDEPAYRNGLSNATTVVVQAPLLGTATYHYAYDAYDNELATATTMRGTTYEYAQLLDPLGRPLERIDPAGGVESLRYGADGNLARIDVTNPGQATETYATLTNYNALGELQDLSIDANGVTVARRFYPDAVAIGKLKSIDATSTRQSNASLASLTYHWNALGAVTQIADNRNAPQSQTFGYEDQALNKGMGFLTSASGGYGTKSYQYEQLGNVTQQDATTFTYKSETDQIEGSSGGITWEFSANGYLRTRIAGSNRDEYTFDADGNLVGIVRMPADGAEPASLLLDAAYDHTGRKVLEMTSGGPTVLSVTEDYEVTQFASGAVQHTRTIEGPWGPLAEITASGDGTSGAAGASQRMRVRALLTGSSSVAGKVAQAMFGAFAFVLAPATARVAMLSLLVLLFAIALAIAIVPWLRRREPTAFERSNPFFARITSFVAAIVFVTAAVPAYADLSPGDNGAGVPTLGRKFFVQNLVSSTIAVANDEGAETASVAYEPFGEVDQPSSHGSDDFRPKFTGKAFEASNGLYDFSARRFDPRLGRFISPDPVNQFVSPYLYAGSDPVSMIDPDGQLAFLVPVLIGGAVALGAYFGGAAVNGDYNPANWNWQSGTTWAGIFAGAALAGVGAAAGGLVVQVGIAVGSMGGTAAQIAGIAIGIAGEALIGAGENAAFTALGGGSMREVAESAVTGAFFGAVFGGAAGAVDNLSRGMRSGGGAMDDGARGGRGAAMGDTSDTPCSCGCSFVAGTPVALADGTRKPIETVAVGDALTGRGASRGDVAELVRHDTQELVRITLASGERIDTTPEHLFYVDRSGWVPAAHLSPGSLLATASGTPAIVARVEANHAAQPVTVYNFEVAPTETYHVGEAGVLVHNVKKGKKGSGLCTARYYQGDIKETWNGAELQKRFPGPGEYAAAVKELKSKTAAANRLLRSKNAFPVYTRASKPVKTSSSQYVRKVWRDEKGARSRFPTRKGRPIGIRAAINKLRPNPHRWKRDVDEIISRILGGLTIREGYPQNQRFANALLNYASGAAIGAMSRRMKKQLRVTSFSLEITPP